MSRVGDLKVRRQTLRVRCAQQRRDLSHAIAELRPQLSPPAGEGLAGGAARAARQPLAWLAVLVGLTLLGRTRKALSLVLLLGSAVSLASRLTRLLRMFGSWRAAVGVRTGAARTPAAPERPAGGPSA